MKYLIDAKDKKLGRVATEAAHILMGKNTTSFARNKVAPVDLTITNVSLIDISEKKKEEMEYKWYSGYPGGLRFEKLKEALLKKGSKEVLRRTISGMLPKNKLRSVMIKNLTLVE
jgi:large subunit ribosomal protein L13